MTDVSLSTAVHIPQIIKNSIPVGRARSAITTAPNQKMRRVKILHIIFFIFPISIFELYDAAVSRHNSPFIFFTSIYSDTVLSRSGGAYFNDLLRRRKYTSLYVCLTAQALSVRIPLTIEK